MIEHTVALVKNLRAPKDQKSQLADGITRATESFTDLKNLVDEIPAKQARRIADFTTDPMGWLLSEEDANKFAKFKSILKLPGSSSGLHRKLRTERVSKR